MLTKSYRDYIEIYKKEIKINGIDFFGKGIYELEGSQYRYRMSLQYGKVKNSKILKQFLKNLLNRKILTLNMIKYTYT